MDILHRYLVGNEFHHHVEAIVEAFFTAMHEQLDKERHAMYRYWTERENRSNPSSPTLPA